MRAEKIRNLTLLGVAFLAAFAAATPARADEGYDPMLQITHQFARPNIYIVQDVSGSMAWDIRGTDVGVDQTGTLPTASWALTASSDCSRGKCKSFTYKLTVTQTWPSRMTMVKNALGNSVTIVTPWIEPSEWEDDDTYAYITDPDWQTGTITGPTISHSGSTHTYTWKVAYSARKADPGVPFVAYDSAGKLTVGTGGVSQDPLDLIGRELPPHDATVVVNAHQEILLSIPRAVAAAGSRARRALSWLRIISDWRSISTSSSSTRCCSICGLIRSCWLPWPTV